MSRQGILLACLLFSVVSPATAETGPLQLLAGRFELTLEWTTAGGSGTGRPVTLTDQAGYFWFFSEPNVEIVVKVLDGGAVNGHFWVFYGSMTTVDFVLEIRDTETGAIRRYRPGPVRPQSHFDLRAFVSQPPAGEQALKDHDDDNLPPAAFSVCRPGSTVMCFGEGRFQVEVLFRRPNDEEFQAARVTPLTDESGYFWFFDRRNAEILVKVLDGRRLNRSFWVFAAPLTTLEYQIRVTDTASGRLRTYDHAPSQLAGVADITAFTESANPPAAPIIIEPDADGLELSVGDVHMETAPFSDPDSGDRHYCSDFEIWQSAGAPPSPVDRVWHADCVTGLVKTHIHLGDGVWSGSREDFRFLEPGADHLLRVRHRDDTGVASPWAERPFLAGIVLRVFPLRLDAVAAAPPWTDSAGREVVLPAASPPPELRLESPAGDLFFSFRGLDGAANDVQLGAPLPETAPARLHVEPGGRALELPESEIRLVGGDGAVHTVYLPALVLEAGAAATFWVAENGSTYVAAPSHEQPDFSQLARHTPRPWALRQPGFELDMVAGGFQLPVNLAFVPEPEGEPDSPFFYVTELYGTIKVVSREGTVSDFAGGLLNFDPNGRFPGTGEIGLAGLAVEPVTGDLIATVAYRTDADDDLSPFSGRVIRIEAADGGRRAGRVDVVLDLAPDVLSASHQISDVSLGPGGRLWVHVGDGLQPQRAGDLGSFLGKILRLELDGTAPADNPFYDSSDGIGAADYVYAYGFRNPFAGAWRSADGRLYEVENGPAVDRFARVERGANYHWDFDRDGSGSDEEMEVLAIYNWGPPAHAPVNLAFVEPQTFGGSGFPPERQDRAYVAEFGQGGFPGRLFSGKRISEMVLDSAGNLVAGPLPLVEYDGYARTSLTALAAGPDGLYFGEIFPDDPDSLDPLEPTSRIWRVRWVGGE